MASRPRRWVVSRGVYTTSSLRWAATSETDRDSGFVCGWAPDRSASRKDWGLWGDVAVLSPVIPVVDTTRDLAVVMTMAAQASVICRAIYLQPTPITRTAERRHSQDSGHYSPGLL